MGGMHLFWKGPLQDRSDLLSVLVFLKMSPTVDQIPRVLGSIRITTHEKQECPLPIPQISFEIFVCPTLYLLGRIVFFSGPHLGSRADATLWKRWGPFRSG